MGIFVTKEDLVATEDRLMRLLNSIVALQKEMMERPEREFYSPKEFAQITGWSYQHIVKMCNDGRIKATQTSGPGGGWMILGEELGRLMKNARNNLRFGFG